MDFSYSLGNEQPGDIILKSAGESYFEKEMIHSLHMQNAFLQ